MNGRSADPIASFYDRHPYPPPVDDLEALAARASNGSTDRVAHHLIWPGRDPDDIRSILVAGCGTAQAARHALRNPRAHVVGIDVSTTSIEHTRRLVRRHGIDNLTVHLLPIESVDELGHTFDHIVCTGVLHHLADPCAGLRALRSVMAQGGALTLLVYARYGRAGVYLMQEYCRRLGITTSPADIAELVATLHELPSGHPLGRLLREAPDFADPDALADALLNPRDRAYSVPELLDLIGDAGLRFGRWARQAPYLPDCGSISRTPHAQRLDRLPTADQYAAVELFRGTIDRHTAVAFADDDATSGRLDFASVDTGRWVPIPVPTALAVDDASRLPPGAAAALLNRAHSATDLVRFVDARELATFRAIDGNRTISDLGPDALPLIERLWRDDLVVIDATRSRRTT